MKRSTWSTIAFLLFLGACGGEGGGSGGTGNVVVTPTPTPAPTPTPTPTPIATPTPTPAPFILPTPTPLADDGNWSTLQRDPGHTGYVPASFATASFADAWTIGTPNPPSTVAARAGTIFYNVVRGDGHIYTQAVSSANGASVWGFDLGAASLGRGRRPYGPSYSNNMVASITPNTTSTASPMQVINASTGGYVSTPTYDAQFSDGSVPTPVGNELFYAAGYYGNVVYDANAPTGDRLWRTEAVGQYGGYVMQGESVAVDQSYVYYFKAGSLVVMTRAGAVVRSIQNPFFSKNGISYSGEYVGAPMLDANGHVFTYTDNYSDGNSLPIAAFSFASEKALWRTGYSYTGQPAVRGSRLYAIRSASTIVDLIDTSTGLLAGSIDVGGTENLAGNVVISDSHMFVAGTSTTYAVDLTKAGYPVVWKTGFAGPLTVTPDGYLIIATTSSLHGVKLK